ncbi:MAG TPA: DinB family protein [Lachnospiraceae bacterium]|nr:DinB family protein [Lachnospiraceae bacterium]
MNIVASDWSNRHKELGLNIRKIDRFEEVIRTILELHSEVHRSQVSEGGAGSKVNQLLDDLSPKEYAVMPTSKDETIAWSIWHIARIEDLTMNLLVGRTSQVFDEQWKTRMRVNMTDTGNAMNDDEIMEFSKTINTDELLKYRDAVGKQSRSIVMQLQAGDMKRKIEDSDIRRIFNEGGITDHPDSNWLLDFWGKKDIAGIVLMPLTRHQTLHLNDCDKWKEAIRRGKKAYLD